MTGMMDIPAGVIAASEERRRLAGTLAAVGAGSAAAMADLYSRTSAKLYGICLRILRDEAEAEEVLQETYVTVWRKAAAFDPGRASPITWLAVVARNKAIDRLRGRPSAPAAGLDAAAEVASDEASAFDLVAEAEESGRIAGCLDELDPPARTAIRSAFFEGASYPELAEREGVPLGTMKSWVRRGLMRLKGCLER
ncbi:MAG TPA: sigma-70 family RNA polymerase sigma factor [Allosphingosinicella sp.]|nr:sigma-70 family RNA polymerase sigma factor [Allosphingosinicella sp.]